MFKLGLNPTRKSRFFTEERSLKIQSLYKCHQLPLFLPPHTTILDCHLFNQDIGKDIRQVSTFYTFETHCKLFTIIYCKFYQDEQKKKIVERIEVYRSSHSHHVSEMLHNELLKRFSFNLAAISVYKRASAENILIKKKFQCVDLKEKYNYSIGSKE